MMRGNVSIGRLVFDIPGLAPKQAARIAEQIGHGLSGHSGAFGTLVVTVDASEPDRLASRILAALRQRIG
jgi:hypothetical protein